jgi:hypothetical protein
LLSSRIIRWATTAFLFLLFPLSALAATRTWDAGGADNKWSTAANWSSDAVPTASDIALFDGTGKRDATIDASFGGTVAELRLASSNTGTITVGRSLIVNGNVSLSGGTLSVNGGNSLTVRRSWQNGGGTFSSGTGTVILAGSGTTYGLKETNSFKHLSLDDGLVGYWRFDETSGTSAHDSSRQGEDGILNGGSTYSTNVPALRFTNERSLDFNGTNAYVRVPVPFAGALNVAGNNITMSAWIKLNALNDYGGLIAKTEGSSYWEYSMILNSNGRIGFYSGDTTPNGLSSSGTISDTTSWHHVAFTRLGSIARFYIDGNLSGSSTLTGLWPVRFNDVEIGRDGGWGASANFKGLIDEVRIYERALSASEIAALAAGNPGTGSGKYTLGSAVTVDGNLTLYSGTLDVSSSDYGVTASGSFVNHATFTPRAGTVTLNGPRTTLKMFGASLYNVTIAAAKAAILRAAAVVTHALAINASSTLTLNGNSLTATTASITNAGTLTQGTGVVLHTASLVLSPHTGILGDTLTLTLTDSDENTNGAAQQTVSVPVQIHGITRETPTLTETTASSGIFTATLQSAHGTEVANDGILQSAFTCTADIRATFTDAQDSTDVAGDTASYADSAESSCTDSSSTTAGGSSGGGGGGGGTGKQRPTQLPAPLSSSVPHINTSTTTVRQKALERRASLLQSKINATTSPSRKKTLQKAMDRMVKLIKAIAR